MKEIPHRSAHVKGDEIQPISSVSSSNEFGLLLSKEEIVEKLSSLAVDELVITADAGVQVSEEPFATRAVLTEVPELLAGRTRSAKGVKFGQLGLVHDTLPASSELVAVKYTDTNTAAHEYRMNSYVSQRLSEDVTYKTIGFVRSPRGSIGHITRYENSVVSLDNTLFDPEASKDERLNAMSIAAKYLTTLHGDTLGLVHGDAQAKNIAVDSAQRLRFIDLESTRQVGRNIYGGVVPMPEINKLSDINDFFALPDGAEDWHPTGDEMMRFMDGYLDNQTGPYKLTDEHLFALLGDKFTL